MTDHMVDTNEMVARKLGVDPAFGCCCLTRPACEHQGNNNYCTNIQAAWEVVEQEPNIILEKNKHGFHATMWRNSGDVGAVAQADTAPMAICLAYLKLDSDV